MKRKVILTLLLVVVLLIGATIGIKYQSYSIYNDLRSSIKQMKQYDNGSIHVELTSSIQSSLNYVVDLDFTKSKQQIDYTYTMKESGQTPKIYKNTKDGLYEINSSSNVQNRISDPSPLYYNSLIDMGSMDIKYTGLVSIQKESKDEHMIYSLICNEKTAKSKGLDKLEYIYDISPSGNIKLTVHQIETGIDMCFDWVLEKK